MDSQSFNSIQRALLAVQQANRVRFHMPGHQGGILPFAYSQNIGDVYKADVTELDEMDVITNPTGCLKESQETWAEQLGVAQSYYLTQGATLGLQAALLACCGPDDTVLLARNAHQAVIHGLVLTGSHPQWVLPERHPDWGIWGKLRPDVLEKALERSFHRIKAVVVTSPTYEGVVSDIERLASVCYAYKVLLIVDEAHGALFPYAEQLPSSAMYCGADVVVQSLHKTAGALTPAALAHLPKGSRVSQARYQQALNMLQSTSPSWPLLANIEACGAFLNSKDGYDALQQAIGRVQSIRKNLPEGVSAYNTNVFDPMALLLRFDTHEAPETIAVALEQEYGLAFEAYTECSVLYKIGLGVNDDDVARFIAGIKAYMANPSNLTATNKHESTRVQQASFELPLMDFSPREAYLAQGEEVSVDESVGRISQQTVMTCPPGIPVLVPGELIQAHHQQYLPEIVRVCV